MNADQYKTDINLSKPRLYTMHDRHLLLDSTEYDMCVFVSQARNNSVKPSSSESAWPGHTNTCSHIHTMSLTVLSSHDFPCHDYGLHSYVCKQNLTPLKSKHAQTHSACVNFNSSSVFLVFGTQCGNCKLFTNGHMLLAKQLPQYTLVEMASTTTGLLGKTNKPNLKSLAVFLSFCPLSLLASKCSSGLSVWPLQCREQWPAYIQL